MTCFRDTPEAEAFVASAASRETSPEIMEAIAFIARDLGEAEMLWNGNGFGGNGCAAICHPVDIWEHVTSNGLRDADRYVWGAAGSRWWDELDPRYTIVPIGGTTWTVYCRGERRGTVEVGVVDQETDIDDVLAAATAGDFPAVKDDGLPVYVDGVLAREG